MTVELLWNLIKLVGLGILLILLIGIFVGLIFVMAITLKELVSEWSDKE